MTGLKSVTARVARSRLTRACGGLTAVVVLIVVAANVVVWRAARGHVVNDPAELDGPYDAVIVPGAGVFPGQRPSLTLQSRVRAAVELYHAGVVDHLLASGDNGTESYDEPTVIRRLAYQEGVPLADITLDYAGFSTWQTCVRAKEIFGIERAVFVTQARYANRAAALCSAAGIEVDVLGFGNLRGLPWSRKVRRSIREPIAAVKAVYEMAVRPDPQYLGEFVGLVGSEAPANPDPALGER
jgi:SanA protein